MARRELRSAGSSTGLPGARRASSAAGRRATPPLRRSAAPFRPRRAQRRICQAVARRGQPARRRRHGGGRRQPQSVLNDPLGPLWYRGLVGARSRRGGGSRAATRPRRPADVEQELDAVLAAYGAKRLVIGHTPSLPGIVITNGGRLARIDTGISRYYGGPLSWLEIVGDTLIPHTVQEVGAMKAIRFVAALSLSRWPWRPPAAAQAPTPLFASSDPIQLDDQGAAHLPDAQPQSPGAGRRHADRCSGQSLPISLPLRGITRRTRRSATSRRCASTSRRRRRRRPLFAGQKRLKLVTHCRQSAGVPAICAARICRLPAVQSADAAELPGAAREHRLSRRQTAARSSQRAGFFIEDLKDVAKRNGIERAHAPRAHPRRPSSAPRTPRAMRCSST